MKGRAQICASQVNTTSSAQRKITLGIKQPDFRPLHISSGSKAHQGNIWPLVLPGHASFCVINPARQLVCSREKWFIAHSKKYVAWRCCCSATSSVSAGCDCGIFRIPFISPGLIRRRVFASWCTQSWVHSSCSCPTGVGTPARDYKVYLSH